VVNSLKSDSRLRALLDRLHAQSAEQIPALRDHYRAHGIASVGGTVAEMQAGRPFWRDKLAALEPVKAEFCYALCRAMNARQIVEAGTSYGVSTLYLAAAVRDSGGGTVIATEYEREKAQAARANWAEAGLAQFIDLREGDLQETLKTIDGTVDFLLVDIWTPMARPAIELVAPHMRAGAVVIADNTAAFREAYADYFAYLAEPNNGFSTTTLPFEGGLELSVKTG
jgi:predicted O-methyltransferase YrrM